MPSWLVPAALGAWVLYAITLVYMVFGACR